jgi:hypothetical protein
MPVFYRQKCLEQTQSPRDTTARTRQNQNSRASMRTIEHLYKDLQKAQHHKLIVASNASNTPMSMEARKQLLELMWLLFWEA